MKLSLLPNIITTLRLLAIPPLAWLLLEQKYQQALILALAAGFSDLADGYLAKRFGWITRYGGIVDPLADKLLMLTSFSTLAWLGHLPWWLLYLTLLRDFTIVAGATAYHYLIEPLTAEPTLLGKINTALQVLLVAAVLIHVGFHQLPDTLIAILITLVAALTVITLIQYVWIWAQRTRLRWPS